MAKHRITYRGEAHGPDQTVTWHGHTFRPNEAVQTENTDLVAAAKANPFFEVAGGGKDEADQKGQDEDAEEDEGELVNGYRIESAGRGWYKILDAEGHEVMSGMRKQDAEAWVQARSA